MNINGAAKAKALIKHDDQKKTVEKKSSRQEFSVKTFYNDDYDEQQLKFDKDIKDLNAKAILQEQELKEKSEKYDELAGIKNESKDMPLDKEMYQIHQDRLMSDVDEAKHEL